MIYEHRERDSEFDEQWDEAIETALDLLHARVFQRCLEGDIEPVFYMGEPVAYIRKFDSKIQIEMLRALRPDKFKTPGTNINMGVKGDIFVLTEEQRRELQDENRRQIDYWREHPEEWDRYLEENNHDPRRQPGGEEPK
jgi:hypothetical protein